ncbi:hypothetical protein ACH5RR_006265 [Cinchona calisaya]|uniref:Small auxin up regulated protein n=1 Tax=Cinchona calisaya TaxID=153742 RepID=A0ABD3ANU9_9GENT
MAKGGKLTKIKSVLKKMQSFKFSSWSNNTNGSPIITSATNCSSSSDHDDSYDINVVVSNKDDLHPVYVGKSRRRYLISSDVIENPLFRELADRSGDNCIRVGCEVVLFEHLLWMLENADPQPESLDELVEFYAC